MDCVRRLSFSWKQTRFEEMGMYVCFVYASLYVERVVSDKTTDNDGVAGRAGPYYCVKEVSRSHICFIRDKCFMHLLASLTSVS